MVVHNLRVPEPVCTDWNGEPRACDVHGKPRESLEQVLLGEFDGEPTREKGDDGKTRTEWVQRYDAR